MQPGRTDSLSVEGLSKRPSVHVLRRKQGCAIKVRFLSNTVPKTCVIQLGLNTTKYPVFAWSQFDPMGRLDVDEAADDRYIAVVANADKVISQDE